MKCSYIEELAKLSATGQPFVSVNVIETVGSVPQKSRNKILVTAEGLVYGTVGGGKVEHKAIQEAQQMLTPESSTNDCLVEWNLQNDVGMTCGGVVKMYFEVYNRNDWRVVVFGAGHVSQALLRCLAQLECKVTCIDPREDWLAKLPPSDRLKTVCRPDPAEQVANLTNDDFIVCMTMGHGTDMPILAAIYQRQISGTLNPPYIGVIGSSAKRKVLQRELAEQGIPAEVSDSVICPIGLKIGSSQPAEIAISIAAELLKYRDARTSDISS